MYTRTSRLVNFPFFSRKIQCHIAAVSDIDFNKIDTRIKSDGAWQETYPARTKIFIPDDCIKEIKEKLVNYPGITSVDGVLTRQGEEVNKKILEWRPKSLSRE